MEYVSSDTNIWLDFNSISKIELPFRLDYTYIMYEEALRREIISPQKLASRLKSLGLQGVDITTEEFYLAEELAVKYVKLSGYDRTALSIAKCRGIPLLTGDAALRKAAEEESIQVMGSLGIMDKLLEDKLIKRKEYREVLQAWKAQIPLGRRLPMDEIDKRLK